MKLPSKQEMVILTNSLRQAAAANTNIYRFSDYDFIFDSVLHHLEIEPRDLCGNYKSMFEDLKFYDAFTDLKCEYWLMIQINLAKQADEVECDLKHVIYVDTNDNSQKVIERSLDMLCTYTYYNIDKIVIFPYNVL